MSNEVCDKIAPLLSARIDGELTHGEETAVSLHLEQCAGCQDRLLRLQGAVALLKSEAPAPEDSSDFLAHLHRRLSEQAVLGFSEVSEPDDDLEQGLPESGSGRLRLVALAGSVKWRAGLLRTAVAAGLLIGIALGVRQVERGFGDLREAWTDFGSGEQPASTVARGDFSEERLLLDRVAVESRPNGSSGDDVVPEEADSEASPSMQPAGFESIQRPGDGNRPGNGVEPVPSPLMAAVEEGLGSESADVPQVTVEPLVGSEGHRPPAAEPEAGGAVTPTPSEPSSVVAEAEARRQREALVACAHLIQIATSKQSQPEARETAILDLGDFDLPPARALLRDVLVGGLDHLAGAPSARLAAFTALGRMRSLAAAETLVHAGLGSGRGVSPEALRTGRLAARRALAYACLQTDELACSVATRYLAPLDKDARVTAAQLDAALLVSESFGRAGPGLAREAVDEAARALEFLQSAHQSSVDDSRLLSALVRTLGQTAAARHGRMLVDLVRVDPSSCHWSIREAAAEALGTLGENGTWGDSEQTGRQADGGTTDQLRLDSVVSCLSGAMRGDPDQRVREMAAIALGRIPVVASLEALLAWLPTQAPVTGDRRALYGCQSTSLLLLTGQVHSEPREWSELVDQVGADGLLQPSIVREKLLPAEIEGAKTFFGLPGQASSVLFLLDISDSMRHEGKMDLAKRQLVRMIETLDSHTRFSVWAFSDSVQRLLPTPRPATRSLQSRMISRVRQLRARQGAKTRLEQVLQLSLEPGHIDSVVLLTDGLMETDGLAGVETVLEQVGFHNSQRRSVLHVVGVFRGESSLHLDRGSDQGHLATDLLRRLAHGNKGLLIRN